MQPNNNIFDHLVSCFSYYHYADSYRIIWCSITFTFIICFAYASECVNLCVSVHCLAKNKWFSLFEYISCHLSLVNEYTLYVYWAHTKKRIHTTLHQNILWIWWICGLHKVCCTRSARFSGISHSTVCNTFMYVKEHATICLCIHKTLYINICFAQTKFVKHKEKIIFEFAFYRFGFLHIYKVSIHTHSHALIHIIFPIQNSKWSVSPFARFYVVLSFSSHHCVKFSVYYIHPIKREYITKIYNFGRIW